MPVRGELVTILVTTVGTLPSSPSANQRPPNGAESK